MSHPPFPIPTDRPQLAPCITVPDGPAAIAFYIAAFGATEIERMAEPGGRIGHAELRFGDSVLSLSDQYPEYGAQSPRTLGGSPATLQLYVADVDCRGGAGGGPGRDGGPTGGGPVLR